MFIAASFNHISFTPVSWKISGLPTESNSIAGSGKRKKTKHSSIYEIQEKANRELVKLYEKTPEVLENAEPIEISIPAPKTKPAEALVTVPVLPQIEAIPEYKPDYSKPVSIPVFIPVKAKPAPVKQVVEQKITIPDEMDDEEAIAAILALIQEVEA